ncbi:MAG: histidine phosphatase family protein [Pseudomonadota bacterium]
MSAQTTTVIVIRHGETLWNVQARYQGHGDSPLTATGKIQADAVGRRLKAEPVDRLIASDLGRTRDTAAIIAGQTGHRPIVDARLRERSFGVLEGLTAPQIQVQHPELFKHMAANDPDFVIPGGESLRQHYRRNIGFLEDCRAAYPGRTVALVAHGGVLDSVFRHVAGIPLDRPRSVVTTNASISVFRHGVFYGTLRWVLETWGDTAHLAGIDHQPDF